LEVEFFANADPAATYVIKVWTGALGTTEVVSQDVGSFVVDDWNNVVLTSPHTISSAEELWIGYEVTHGAGTFPAGCDDGPAIQYNGDMISTGGGWQSMSADFGLDYNWNIAAYVGITDKVSEPMVKIVQPTSTSTNFVASGSIGSYSKSDNMTYYGTKDLDYYNVYLKAPGTSFFMVIGNTTETEYTYEPEEKGLHTFYVTAVWDPEGESDPSNEHEVDVITGIEEILFNSTSIYPNPAADVVNIKSDFEIVSLRVYSHTGQIVSEEVINNNIYTFDASQYNAGIYMFQIETAEGTITKRIIIQ